MTILLIIATLFDLRASSGILLPSFIINNNGETALVVTRSGMSFIESLWDFFVDTMFDIWQSAIELLPIIILAVIVILVGMFVAEGVGKLLSKTLSKVYLDKASERTGLQRLLQTIGVRLPISRVLGVLVTWFLYAVVLIAAAEILQLDQISEFLRSVVLYIPNVIVAVVIFVVGVIISNFVFTLVKETSANAGFSAAQMLGNLARWSILVFTLMAALVQLNVASDLIRILFTGFVLMLSLAGGIAFGLGGKDMAKDFLDRLGRK